MKKENVLVSIVIPILLIFVMPYFYNINNGLNYDPFDLSKKYFLLRFINIICVSILFFILISLKKYINIRFYLLGLLIYLITAVSFLTNNFNNILNSIISNYFQLTNEFAIYLLLLKNGYCL